MTPLPRNRWKRKALLASEKARKMGIASQRVQAERRLALVTPEYLRDLAEIEIMNLPRKQGDPLGCLQWHEFGSGRVRRWVVRIGDRIDRVTLHSPDGRKTRSHGGTWVMDHLRAYIFGRKKHSAPSSSSSLKFEL